MDYEKELKEKLKFYKDAYRKESRNKDKNEEELRNNRELYYLNATNFFKSYFNTIIDDTEKKFIEDNYGVNIGDIDEMFVDKKVKLDEKINEIKNDVRYKEYVKLQIDDNLDIVERLEDDEVFDYLIDQNFHNEKFVNEPYFNILGFEFQPRYWKFKKYANKKAREFGFVDYKHMFELWKNLRLAYESLIGDKKIAKVIEEYKQLENRLKKYENEIENLPIAYSEEVIKRVVKTIENLDTEKLFYIQDTEYDAVIQLKKSIDLLKERQKTLENRIDILLKNIDRAEEMIAAAERGKLKIDESIMKKFIENNDPYIPVFEIIPEKEWVEIKKAFEDKGIKLKADRTKYSVVRRKLSPEEKERKLKEYGVKEGEIFIDKNLVGRRYIDTR